jgi:hypothetical protein
LESFDGSSPLIDLGLEVLHYLARTSEARNRLVNPIGKRWLFGARVAPRAKLEQGR